MNFRWQFARRKRNENDYRNNVVDMASAAKYCRACFPFDIWTTERHFSRRSRSRVEPVPGRNIARPHNRRKALIFREPKYVGARIRPYPSIALFGSVILGCRGHSVVIVGMVLDPVARRVVLFILYRKMGRPVRRRNS